MNLRNIFFFSYIWLDFEHQKAGRGLVRQCKEYKEKLSLHCIQTLLLLKSNADYGFKLGKGWLFVAPFNVSIAEFNFE